MISECYFTKKFKSRRVRNLRIIYKKKNIGKYTGSMDLDEFDF
jgi:hypothetical protein